MYHVMKMNATLLIFHFLCLLCGLSAVLGKSKDKDESCDNSEEQNLEVLAVTSMTCGALIGGGTGLLGTYLSITLSVHLSVLHPQSLFTPSLPYNQLNIYFILYSHMTSANKEIKDIKRMALGGAMMNFGLFLWSPKWLRKNW